MGGLFYRLGDGDQALDAFELALAHQPNMRAALIGSAMAHTQKKDYASASERLRTVLRYNPNDAEVWMNLGDVAIYRGDESLARDCYLRASRIDPLATEVIENARKRLALMDDSASGRKNGPVNSKR
jgi:cytochrome c-type biogenesis protein CcmH/NrfG